MPTYPISQPADNAAAYTYTQPIRDSIAGVNDHQTRITTLEGTAGSGGYATVQDEGTARTQRAILNFVGAGVTVTDNVGNTRTDVTIPSSGGVGGPVAYSADAFGTLSGKGQTSPNTATDDGPIINSAITAARASTSPHGTVYIPAGCYNIKTKIQLYPGIHLTGAGSGLQGGAVGTTLYGHSSLVGPVIDTATGEFLHHTSVTRLAVRTGPSHGIVIDSAGENIWIDQVFVANCGGDGIRITGPSTPLHIGRVSLHNCIGSGLHLVGQTVTHAQIIYVAGDNHGVALIEIDNLDTTGTVRIIGWKAERWNDTSAPSPGFVGAGNPSVIKLNNCNGGYVDCGQGRVHSGSGVTAGTNIILNTADSTDQVARCRFRVSEEFATNGYTNGYRDIRNNVTISVAEAVRSTMTVNEPIVSANNTAFSLLSKVANGPGIYASAGSTSPEGIQDAVPGSLCMTGNGNCYRKSTGTGTTGWVSIS